MKKPSKTESFHKNLEMAKGDRPIPPVGIDASLAVDEQHIENCLKRGEVIVEDIGRTLAKIQEEKKYPEKTFELYVKRRWEKTARWGYLMIESYANAKNFSQNSVDIKRLSSQSQKSALAKAPPEKQAEILDKVVKEGKVTAKKITQKIEEEEADFRVIIRDGNDEEVPESITAEFQHSREETKRVKGLLQEVRRWVEHEEPYKVEVSRATTIESIKDAIASVAVAAGEYLCPYCEGKKCKVCHQRGFVSKVFYAQSIPDDKKK